MALYIAGTLDQSDFTQQIQRTAIALCPHIQFRKLIRTKPHYPAVFLPRGIHGARQWQGSPSASSRTEAHWLHLRHCMCAQPSTDYTSATSTTTWERRQPYMVGQTQWQLHLSGYSGTQSEAPIRREQSPPASDAKGGEQAHNESSLDGVSLNR